MGIKGTFTRISRTSAWAGATMSFLIMIVLRSRLGILGLLIGIALIAVSLLFLGNVKGVYSADSETVTIVFKRRFTVMHISDINSADTEINYLRDSFLRDKAIYESKLTITGKNGNVRTFTENIIVPKKISENSPYELNEIFDKRL